MSDFYDILHSWVKAQVNAAWPELHAMSVVPQFQRYNYSNLLQQGDVSLPMAILHYGEFVADPEYSRSAVVFKVRVSIFYVAKFDGERLGGDTAFLYGKLITMAELLPTVAQAAGINLLLETFRIDATENNPIATIMLQRDLNLTAGQLSFEVLTGFVIGQT